MGIRMDLTIITVTIIQAGEIFLWVSVWQALTVLMATTVTQLEFMEILTTGGPIPITASHITGHTAILTAIFTGPLILLLYILRLWLFRLIHRFISSSPCGRPLPRRLLLPVTGTIVKIPLAITRMWNVAPVAG